MKIQVLILLLMVTGCASLEHADWDGFFQRQQQYNQQQRMQEESQKPKTCTFKRGPGYDAYGNPVIVQTCE